MVYFALLFCGVVCLVGQIIEGLGSTLSRSRGIFRSLGKMNTKETRTIKTLSNDAFL